MTRFLVIMSMVFGALFGNATLQPLEGSSSPQQKFAAVSSGATPGSQQVSQYGNTPAGSSPQSSVAPPQFYYPTYPEYKDPGYSVQSGYEGYLVPSATPVPQSTWNSGLWSMISPVSSFALGYGARAGIYLLNLLLLLFLGGIFTTSVCTFTPLCTITILGLGKSQVKESVTELARTYMTPERISAATSLVKRAIDKYAAMQKQPIKDEAEKADDESS
ncbi:uncharacterized protein LOC105690442 [Athalia rosae]|uniref:uncharacterized protein LOC105690442 n=1 Tax=Athalia rosae TaxID=37344 RepID=UPI000A0ED841|nr:uncharacterized protein LOC105690442 [Athalia rosae]